MKLKGHRNVARAGSLSSKVATHTRATMEIDKEDSVQSLLKVTKANSAAEIVDQAIEREEMKTASDRADFSHCRDIGARNDAADNFEGSKLEHFLDGKKQTTQKSTSIGVSKPKGKYARVSAAGTSLRIQDIANSCSGIRRVHSMPNISLSWKNGRAFNRTRTEEYRREELFPTILQLPKVVKPCDYNEQRASQLASNVVENINDAGTCMLISLAHQLGLFAVMAKLNDRPRSIKSIAKMANGLSPRYLQELLAALTCVGIIQETIHATSTPADQPLGLNLPWTMTSTNSSAPSGSPVAGNTVKAHTKRDGNSQNVHLYSSSQPRSTRRKYLLPKEHAVYLTWGNGSDNLALLTQYIPVLGRIEDEVVACFRSGEGMDWTRYGQFDLVSELDTQQTIGEVANFEEDILGMVPGLRDTLVTGTSILCLGSGVGIIFASIAKAFPKSWFTIYEGNSQKAEAAANVHSSIPNLHFAALSASSKSWNSISMLENRTYTAAFVLDASIVRDAPNPEDLLKRVHGALRPGASLLMLEYVTGCGDAAPLLSGISALQSVPLGIASGGPALGRCWGAEAAARALRQVGFYQVDIRPRRGDDINRVIVAKTAGGNQL